MILRGREGHTQCPCGMSIARAAFRGILRDLEAGRPPKLRKKPRCNALAVYGDKVLGFCTLSKIASAYVINRGGVVFVYIETHQMITMILTLLPGNCWKVSMVYSHSYESLRSTARVRAEVTSAISRE